MDSLTTYRGGCHCGAVRFEFQADTNPVVHECNCSICTKSGFLHLIVPKTRFRLLRGEEQLTTYTFNPGVARHTFCKCCGVKSFYVPRSNPDGFSINVRCLEPSLEHFRVEPFDGRNWERSAHRLAGLTEKG